MAVAEDIEGRGHKYLVHAKVQRKVIFGVFVFLGIGSMGELRFYGFEF